MVRTAVRLALLCLSSAPRMLSAVTANGATLACVSWDSSRVVVLFAIMTRIVLTTKSAKMPFASLEATPRGSRTTNN